MTDTIITIFTILAAIWLFFTVTAIVLMVIVAFQKVKLERELNTFLKNEREKLNDKYKQQ